MLPAAGGLSARGRFCLISQAAVAKAVCHWLSPVPRRVHHRRALAKPGHPANPRQCPATAGIPCGSLPSAPPAVWSAGSYLRRRQSRTAAAKPAAASSASVPGSGAGLASFIAAQCRHQQVGNGRADAGGHVVAGAGRVAVAAAGDVVEVGRRQAVEVLRAIEQRKVLPRCETGRQWRAAKQCRGRRDWCRQTAPRECRCGGHRNRRSARRCWDRRRRRCRGFPACRWGPVCSH